MAEAWHLPAQNLRYARVLFSYFLLDGRQLDERRGRGALLGPPADDEVEGKEGRCSGLVVERTSCHRLDMKAERPPLGRFHGEDRVVVHTPRGEEVGALPAYDGLGNLHAHCGEDCT